MLTTYLGWLPVALCVVLLLGCGSSELGPPVDGDADDVSSNDATENEPAALGQVLGEWVVVADTAGQGHTGTLTINADGTFSGDYQASGTTDTFEGTYEITSEDFMGAQTVVVEQTITLYNGSVPPKTPPLRLFFDPCRGILQDILTVAYARKGSEEEGSE